jgi:hypothetical protein
MASISKAIVISDDDASDSEGERRIASILDGSAFRRRPEPVFESVFLVVRDGVNGREVTRLFNLTLDVSTEISKLRDLTEEDVTTDDEVYRWFRTKVDQPIPVMRGRNAHQPRMNRVWRDTEWGSNSHSLQVGGDDVFKHVFFINCLDIRRRSI